ncbi:hypothetical protein ACEPAI_3893 [Sanghuangporus weigelae]
MPVNHVAEQVFGIAGTVCWTGQIIPQIWKSWREKSTEGLSPWLMLIWGISSVFLGVFVIVQDLNIPLIVQPQVFGFLSMLSWCQASLIQTTIQFPSVDVLGLQCLYYGYRFPLRKVAPIFLLIIALLGGFEAGMVFAIRPAVDNGNQRPVTFFGIMTSILLAAGLLPQYWEIIRFPEVKGISLPFITIDTLGGVFSLLSLVFREKFDVLGGVAYSLVVVLDGIVIILALILNPRAERRRKRLAQENEEHESQLATVVNGTADEQFGGEADPGIASRQQSTSSKQSRARTEIEKDDEATTLSNDVHEKS